MDHRARAADKTPLPRQLAVLALLLRRVDEVLEFLELSHQRQRQRLAIVTELLGDPAHVLTRREFGHELAAASRKHFAAGARAPSALLPYLDQRALAVTQAELQQAISALPKAGVGGPNRELFAEWARRFEEYLSAEANVIEIYRALEQEIVAAIERRGADKPDAGADTPDNSAMRLPRNADVLLLARRINDNLSKEGSQISIALQFTDGDEVEANSLLRQLRRYPHLLNSRHGRGTSADNAVD